MIGSAYEKNGYVYILNEKNQQTGHCHGKLMGFTGSQVTVQRGNYLYFYNEKGANTGQR